MKRDRETETGIVRECWNCGYTKRLSDFPDSTRGICGQCKRRRARAYFREGRLAINPERKKEADARYLARRAMGEAEPTTGREYESLLPVRPLLDRLDAFAKEHAMPLSAIAEQCDISPRTLYRWRKGETTMMSERTADRVLTFLGWHDWEVWRM
jgi:hypothetical protein